MMAHISVEKVALMTAGDSGMAADAARRFA
jgi:hypothetical protein